MSGRLSSVIVAAALSAFVVVLPASVDAQSRWHHPPPMPPGHFPVRGHVVFVGGYFYDPHFGPYPWWAPNLYPYAYFPLTGVRADLRVLATPKEAAVYVDGFYAGIVNDFDGIFQGLPLPPGGHEITLFYEGYRTARQCVYLGPGSDFKLHLTMERLPAGVASEPVPIAPPVPPPPMDSYIPFATPPRDHTSTPPVPGAIIAAAGYGSVELHVQPASARVTIDGERWTSAAGGQFVLQLAVGSHLVEVDHDGFLHFSSEVQVRQGETIPLNVVLSKERP
jgi:hypothetical protein